YILDATDHVWTEVWSRKQKRWLHCDACENACDSPLTYERGWGKRLTHVTAFGRDHVRDVAWRYSQDHRALVKRRAQICSESALAKVLQVMNSILLEKYVSDEYRRKELQNQFIQELVEFICPRKTLKENETQGRISGNLDWRSQRGELGGAMTSLNLADQSKLS
uniref:Rad4/PNGase transglutaminase-like fold domain-containing protein n=1 Tax=Romanomermis culicivorax TaxID=13658 RepID=A0A915IC68_ROMCU